MVEEVLRCLRPRPGDVAVDCTLGGGGHARAILERVQPGGRLIGLDVDPLELPRTEARLRAAGFGPETFTAHHGNFAGLPQVLAAEGLAGADLVARGPRRVLDAARQPGSRLQLQGRRPARHADEPVARRTGLAAARARERSHPRAHAPRERRRAARRAHRPPAEAAAARHDPRAGAPGAHRAHRGAAVAREARREGVGSPDLPGAADRGERRVLGARCVAARAAALPRARRPRGDPDLPLRRGPAGEEVVPGGSSRGHLRRRGRRSDPLHGGRNAREPSRIVGEAALGRAERRAYCEPCACRRASASSGRPGVSPRSQIFASNSEYVRAF